MPVPLGRVTNDTHSGRLAPKVQSDIYQGLSFSREAVMHEDKTLVTEEQIREALKDLEGWEYDRESKALQRIWRFQKFVPTMAFVRTLTQVMDTNNHHSDIHLDSRKKTLTVTVTTHSENAVTRADLDFASAVNAAE
jgi:4a-hydroxytetrahydrobiopterin dehydratase